jgi:hypothetical protein
MPGFQKEMFDRNHHSQNCEKVTSYAHNNQKLMLMGLNWGSDRECNSEKYHRLSTRAIDAQNQVIIHLIHSMFAMMDMMKPAGLIMAVICKECIKSFVEGLPWTLYSGPSNT